MNLQGFIAIDKPRGITSFDCLKKVRAILNEYLRTQGKKGKVRIGHTGTLDPDAQGVLVLAVGKATKLFDLFLQKEKTYQTTFKFGILTDTLDSTGKVLIENDCAVTMQEIQSVIPKLIGIQQQVPPNFSAKKIKGVRAYDLARAGKEFTVVPKEVEIKEIQLLKQIADNEFLFEITCSSGTYIRSIVRDMADKLSTCGITTSIIRTKSGIFNQKETLGYTTLNLDKILKNLKQVDFAFPHISKMQLVDCVLQKLFSGVFIESQVGDGLYFTQNSMGIIHALAEVKNHTCKNKIYLKEEDK